MAIRYTDARSLMLQARSNTTGSLNILKFPDDLESVPHKMLINIRSYTRAGAGRLSIPTGSNTRAAIALPVPRNVTESYNVTYNNADLGILGNALSNAIDSAINTNENLLTTIGNFGRDVLGVGRESGTPIRSSILNVGQAIAYQGAIAATSTAAAAVGLGGTAAAIQAGTGLVFNPHTTAIFSSVNIRTMIYQWTLAPKTEKESRNIEEIVRTLRNAMLPYRGTNELFLRFPDQIEYKILGAEPDYDMPTTPCVITGIDLNRSPQGPVFFAKTGAPVLYGLTINLSEIRALTRDDFTTTNLPPNNPTNPVIVPPATGNVGFAEENPNS
jgi:hypothetical protein